MIGLNRDEVDFYWKYGYYLYKHQLFSAQKMDQLRGIFEEHLANRGEALSDELDTPHFRDPRLLDFLLSAEVGDLLEPVIGPNIALFSSHFICKDPYTGRATPWHEDSAFWNGRFDRYEGIITIWLAIDRSTRENGCMQVLPGTQVNGFSAYEHVDLATNTFDREIKALDTSTAVAFELHPGELSLHDARIVHGADPNTSPHRRCGYTMRYFPTSLKLLPERNKGWRLWLVRGHDLAGNSYENA